MKRIKLSRWAKDNDMSYVGTSKLVASGRFPFPLLRLKTGRILVEIPDEEVSGSKPYVLYARVSSHDQKANLVRQMERLKMYAAREGLLIQEQIAEIGSGLNGTRGKLIEALGKNVHILVEHKDRLCRFGFEYLEASLAAQDRHIVVINQTEEKMDIVQDFVDICTSMCSRIYGKRSARSRAKRMNEAGRSFSETTTAGKSPGQNASPPAQPATRSCARSVTKKPGQVQQL